MTEHLNKNATITELLNGNDEMERSIKGNYKILMHEDNVFNVISVIFSRPDHLNIRQMKTFKYFLDAKKHFNNINLDYYE